MQDCIDKRCVEQLKEDPNAGDHAGRGRFKATKDEPRPQKPGNKTEQMGREVKYKENVKLNQP